MRRSNSSGGYAYRLRRRRKGRFPAVAVLLTLGLGGFLGLAGQGEPPAVPEPKLALQAPAPQPTPLQQQRPLDARLSPNPVLGSVAPTFGRSEPMSGRFIPAVPPQQVAALDPDVTGSLARPTDIASPATAILKPVQPAAEEPPHLALISPMPVPRPADLKAPPPVPEPRLATRAVSPRAKDTLAKAEAVDNRNFFEKLFGVSPQSSGERLAYAAPQDDIGSRRGSGLTVAPPVASTAPMADSKTAIYDISSRTVYLPNGEQLEAHSGLGDKMDDLRFVHVRMHGPTPPHVYDLTEREALFHGVRAIRLNPVGGSAKIFGRAGLLAHSYLLGPRGDSNGCVSIKDYDRFLQAFLRGEIKRLIVRG
jgi:hypothetical protein